MSLDWSFPYPSRRSPVLARNVVSTSQPLAAQAGLQALAEGGNAVDAALTAAITLTVVEPVSNGIGSDAYAIIWDGDQLHGLNASGRSPAAMTPDRFAGLSQFPERGWDSVTVPGCVSAWQSMSQKFGKLPFERLFRDAIRYAEDGWLVSPVISIAWNNAIAALGDQPDWVRDFLIDGAAPQPGELFRFHQQAETLRAIARSDTHAYYHGELAERMVAHSTDRGGCLSLDDLKNHKADWVDTISVDYHGYQLHEIPPNGQGLAALIALGVLRHFDMASMPIDSVDSVHLQVEAMKYAVKDAFAHIADIEHMQTTVEALLDDSRLKSIADAIDPQRASAPQPVAADSGGTVYLTTADQDGMMVSFIQSNYMGFGSGIVVPDTGISLQNRGAGFVLEQGHPNQIAPSKRPFQTIIPGFLMHGNEPVMSFGVMGGHMQAQGHVQMTLRYVDHHQNPQAASDAPRWHVTPDFNVVLEKGFSADVEAGLKARGHTLAWPEKAETFGGLFGGAQLIARLPDGYVAGSEHRKDGQAVGF